MACTRSRPKSSAEARKFVLLVPLVSGVLGGAAGCAPVGAGITDHILTGALAAAVTFAAAYASGPSLILASAIVVAAGDSWPLHFLGAVALLGTLLADRYSRDLRLAHAVLGTVIVQALLRLPWTAPARGSAAVALVAMLLITISGVRGAPPRSQRVVAISALALTAVAIVVTLAAVYAVVRSHTLLGAAERETRNGVEAARAGNRNQAADAFAAAGRHFDDASAWTGSWLTLPARQLPIVGPQLRVLDTVASIGVRTIPLVSRSITRVDPNQLRLVDGRLNLATVASYRPIFDQLERATSAAKRRLARLPRTWLIPTLDDRLARFEVTVAKADDSAYTADEAVTLAPYLLGGSGTRTYLLAIVSPAEARGSGGVLANYGVLTVSNGRLRLAKIGRSADLTTAGPRTKHLSGPSEYLARYGKFDPATTWENVTMSPDFPAVGDVMAQLYPQSGGVAIDGVIRLDPVAFAGLLKLTGPVRVAGLPLALNADNVVQFLLRDEYTLITDKQQRVDLLGNLARVVFDRLTSGRSAQPSTFANALSPASRTGNLALWFRDARSQAFAHRIGTDAELPALRGDTFGLIVQNGGGNKIDYYLQRSVRYTATVNGASGHVSARAEIVLHNGAPSSGLPSYVIGNAVGLPIGTSRLYVSLYSPFALKSLRMDGRPFGVLPEREGGRNVFSAFIDIPPGRTRTIELDLDGSVDLSGAHYRFEYLAQVLPNADRVDLAIRTVGAQV
ncbi:MAG: hypothetical protein JWM53_3228, partial [bacterium]|nr:hypothetical protein [bacterium]